MVGINFGFKLRALLLSCADGSSNVKKFILLLTQSCWSNTQIFCCLQCVSALKRTAAAGRLPNTLSPNASENVSKSGARPKDSEASWRRGGKRCLLGSAALVSGRCCCSKHLCSLQTSCDCISAFLHLCISASLHLCIPASLRPCISVSLRPCISAASRLVVIAFLCPCISVSLHPCISVSLHPCISVSLHPCISVSLHHCSLQTSCDCISTSLPLCVPASLHPCMPGRK